MLAVIFFTASMYHPNTSQAAAYERLRVRVPTSGLYQITQGELNAAGWPNIDLSRVALWYRGIEQPMSVVGSSVQFVARPERSRYRTEAVYWLSYESRPALRGVNTLQPGEPIAWEKDALYESRVAAPNGDHWFSAELVGAQRQVSIALNVPALAEHTRLLVDLASPEAGAHSVAVTVDGNTTQLDWSGKGSYRGVVLLKRHSAGVAQLQVQNLSNSLVLLDRIELPDVAPAFSSQAKTPVIERGSTYDFVMGPSANQRGASYLIISHTDFLPALGPLVEAHKRLGDTVSVLDVQAAYDAFSFGERDPEAIRSLLRVSQQWQPAPQQVLLVGSGTVNMRGVSVASAKIAVGDQLVRVAPRVSTETTFIPPYLVMADPLRGEVACDTCFARLQTNNPLDQIVPDLAIGRLPVRTLDEARAVVAKTVSNLIAPPAGVWQSRAVFLADNDREANGSLDPAGPFSTVADQGVLSLPRGIQAERFYYAPERSSASGPYDPDISSLRCRLFRVIDGGSKNDNNCSHVDRENSGAALLTYVGHGSAWQWGFASAGEAASYLWYLYDADGRTNGQKLPILLALTCMSGDFANPYLVANDERLVVWPNGGVVAAFSSSGQGVNTGHAELMKAMMPSLYSTDDRSLGSAHLAGIAQLRSGYRDLAFSYNILGDPSVRLAYVPSEVVFLPTVRK